MAPRPRAAATPGTVDTLRSTAAGRAMVDRLGGVLFGAVPSLIPPPSADATWRDLKLDTKTLAKVSPTRLVELLADISPDVGRALYDFLRECNAGWECTAYPVGTDTNDPEAVPDDAATAAVHAVLGTLAGLYGTPDVPINRMLSSIWLRGGVLSELVLAPDGRTVADLAVPDPATLLFRQVQDPVRGTVYQPGQMQGGQFVVLDRPTISYIPVDPMPGSPYGRPLVAPAVFVTLFMLGLLHDLRRVIAQQGYPRLDITVKSEKLDAEMAAQRIAPAARAAFVQAAVQQIADTYGAVEPDDAWVHTDLSEITKAVGTVGQDSLGGIGTVITALERMSVRALKTMPFMMALTESTTESQANRQFEQHAIAVRSMQHIVEVQLERLLGVALQAQGILAVVKWRFAENRASEEQRDEQVKQLKVANAAEGYKQGHLSQDEAAHYAWGKATADSPEPRAVAEPAAPGNGAQENPEPSANRGTRVTGTRAKLVPLGADAGFEPLAPLEALSDDERAALSDVWDRSQANGKYKGLLSAVVEDGE